MPRKSKGRTRNHSASERAREEAESSGAQETETVKKEVSDALEAARERVRSLVKREQAGMVLRNDLLNLRLETPQ